MPGIKRVATASPKSAKTSVGKGVAATRPGKATGVTATSKSAVKSADVVRVAAKRAGTAVAAKRASKAPKVVAASKHATQTSAVAAAKRTNKSASGRILIAQHAGKGATPVVKITFGYVSASVEQPTAAHVKRAVTASKKVAKGLGERLVNPGVTLRHPRGVPVFTADPTDPQRVVRRLHGKVERGHFVKGEFTPEESAA